MKKTREELLEIVKKLSLCLAEGDDNGGQTHYVERDGDYYRPKAKGSFIALVQEADEAIAAEEE